MSSRLAATADDRHDPVADRERRAPGPSCDDLTGELEPGMSGGLPGGAG